MLRVAAIGEDGMMNLQIVPLAAPLGAEIRGVNPGAELDDATFEQIRRAWFEHCILLFRDARFSPASLVAFTRRFGELHTMQPRSLNLDGYPHIFVVSNRIHNGKPVGLPRAGWGWHSDGEDKLLPNAGSLLYALNLTSGEGDTEFANMYRVLDALPKQVRARIAGRRARFSRIDRHLANYPNLPPLTEADKQARPDVYHPLIRQHPESGRKSLYLGRWACDIEAMDAEEGRELIAYLREFSVRPEFVYRHRWRSGDAILWDNRCTQHCALPFDDARYERHMHRTTLEGDLPRCAELHSSLAADL
ncbi:MAG: taurine dioxygenase [Gammaproteobacteria bacterium]